MLKSESNVERVAAYLRFSSEGQRGNTSLDVQLRLINQWADARDAVIVKIYTDEAKSGKGQIKRDALQDMKRDAELGAFDTICTALNDRLGRNAAQNASLRSYLRDKFGIKFALASGISADDGEDGFYAFAETVQDAQSQLYSDEHSKKIKESNYELFLAGFFNGSKPPYGYDLDKIPTDKIMRDGSQQLRTTLKINEHQAQGVILAYEAYSTGKHSYFDIATLLNEGGWRTPFGSRFGDSSMNDIFSNITYTGQITYQGSRFSRDRSKRFYDNPVEVRPGKHPAIISQDLFDAVQAMRKYRANSKRGANGHNDYLLQGLVWCYGCYQDAEKGKIDGVVLHGKCHCKTEMRDYGAGRYSYYMCVSRKKGYPDCPQPKTRTEGIDEQVMTLLNNLKVPYDWRKRLIKTVAETMKDEAREKHLAELTKIYEADNELFRYGLIIDKAEFLSKQVERKAEIDKLALTVNTEVLEPAADLIDNFPKHFAKCNGDTDAENRLISRIIERVFITGKLVVAVMFRTDAHDVLHLGGDLAIHYDNWEFTGQAKQGGVDFTIAATQESGIHPLYDGEPMTKERASSDLNAAMDWQGIVGGDNPTDDDKNQSDEDECLDDASPLGKEKLPHRIWVIPPSRALKRAS